MAGEDWLALPLGELTENFDGRRVPVKELDRKAGPYPYYGASGVVDRVDGYLFDGEYLLIGEDGENLRTRQTPIAFMATGKFWVNNHAHILRGNHRADTRFLCYVLSKTDISGYLTGSTMPKLTQGNLNRIPVVVPPLPEQKAIAAVLGALDDKIELNRRMNATLEAIARALFQSWFVDFDPVRAKLDGRRPIGLDEVTAALFPSAFHETKLGHIPLEWHIGNLGDLCKLKRGHDLPTSSRTAGDIPVISSSGFSGTHGEAKVIGPGVVTGRYGTIGKVFFVETDYWPLNTTLYVEDFLGNPPRYIFHILGEVDYSIYTDKAAVPGVNRNHLHEDPMVIPPMAIRRAFADLVAPLWAKHSSNEHQSRTLSALRGTLLPKLLSGELSSATMKQKKELYA